MGNILGGGGGKAAAKGVHSTVYMDVCVGKNCGRITMDLCASTPKTSENFRQLCTGEKGMGTSGKPLHFKGSGFHRIIPGFMAQGGDFTHGSGIGGESIYGASFPDENFDEKHSERGTLSMANSGPDSNGSQFFMTFAETPHLDGAHVVFGKVVDGHDMLDAMEKVGTGPGTPTQKVTIEDCGQLTEQESKA